MPTKEEREQAKISSIENLRLCLKKGSRLEFTLVKDNASAGYRVYEISSGYQILTGRVCGSTGYRWDKKAGGLGIGGSHSPAKDITEKLADVLFGDKEALTWKEI